MKNVTKVCLISAAVIGGLGIAFTITGAVCGASYYELSGFNVHLNEESSSFNENGELLDEYQESFENIEKLDFDIDVMDMTIISGEGEEFIVYAANIDGKFLCEEKNGTLHIENKSRNNWKWDKTPKVVLEVPEGTVFKEADLDVGVGSLEAVEFECEKLKLDCGVGTAYIDGKLSGDCEVKCGIGEVTMSLDNDDEDFNYKVDCGIGNVEVGSNHFSGLGNTRKMNNDAKMDMNIDCGIGSVQIIFR